MVGLVPRLVRGGPARLDRAPEPRELPHPALVLEGHVLEFGRHRSGAGGRVGHLALVAQGDDDVGVEQLGLIALEGERLLGQAAAEEAGMPYDVLIEEIVKAAL